MPTDTHFPKDAAKGEALCGARDELLSMGWVTCRYCLVRAFDQQLRTPTINTPATLCVGSDRYSARVVRVGPSGRQVWIEENDSPGERRMARLVRGKWLSGGNRVCLGFAETYTDPHF